MAPVADFVHDDEIVEAVLKELADNLPASWHPTTGDGYTQLQRLEHGDLSEYEPTQEEQQGFPANICPSIFVCVDRNSRDTGSCGVGGREGTAIPVAVAHVFSREQSLSLSDGETWVQPQRSREQRAKVIGKALWSDANRRLGGPTLTTADTEAKIIEVRDPTVTYKGAEVAAYEIPGAVFAVVLGLVVVVRTQ